VTLYRRRSKSSGYNFPPCPAPGQGVHRWLLSAANYARWQGASPEEAKELLLRAMSRAPQRGEIEQTIVKAFNEGSIAFQSRQGPSITRQSQPIGPLARNQSQDSILISEAVKSGFTYQDLAQINPYAGFKRRSSRTVISALFPAGSLLSCAFGKEYGAKTQALEDFGEFENYRFIVPQPMTAPAGLTAEGKISLRTKANTGPWRFFVYESDTLDFDVQAAVIYELAHYHPLALVVHSGNRSLQAWFYVANLAEDERTLFQCLAIRLGGCKGPLYRGQLVRMPGGWNKKTGKDQAVAFFDPTATQA
jgi:hypothetical protein